MSENKRFEIDLDEEAITNNGEYCLSLYCFQNKGEKDVCYLLNKLNDEIEEIKQENQAIQRKVFKLMDWLETEKGLSKKEIMEWWND